MFDVPPRQPEMITIVVLAIIFIVIVLPSFPRDRTNTPGADLWTVTCRAGKTIRVPQSSALEEDIWRLSVSSSSN